LFEAARIINSVRDNKMTLTAEDLETLKHYFGVFFYDILGMKEALQQNDNAALIEQLMSMVLDMRQEAKATKNWAVADAIRNKFSEVGVQIKDGKDGATWELI
ncbi:MAG: cysteine--tRNA ligase, partial [Bacteroidales bacterium]|nr:cysteine--tRNA ligase [Bacteroidales bacterium]